jgi:DNA-binding response OmpR family regulator
VDTILVAAEASWIRSQVVNAFVSSDQRVVEVERGQGVRAAVAEYDPIVVILDMQIGNMGGIAVALDLRLEAGEGRLPDVPILLLLDREADHFLAKRADVDGTLVKPLDAGRLRRAVKQIVAQGRTPIGETPMASGTDSTGDAEPEAVEMASEG